MDILWRMRIQQLSSLEHYLQEVAALNVLAGLPDAAKPALLAAARSYPVVLRSPGILPVETSVGLLSSLD